MHTAAAVPDDDRAGAVVVGRNDAFEVAVLQRMILGGDRQTLLGRVQRRTLGHRPGDQDTVDLEPQIVVAAPRGVLLDHEHAGALASRPEGLGCGPGAALGPVFF